MSSRIYSIIAFCFIITPLLPAQQSSENLYAPFVSRLEAVVNGQEVVLTWKDARDLNDEVYEVWRYREPPQTGNFDQGERLASVGENRNAFVDRPPDGGEFWYGIYAVKGGRRWGMVVPHRNTTVKPVSIIAEPKEDDEIGHITALSASPKGDKVIINYQTDSEDKEITLYRSTQPITSMAELDKAAPVATFSGMEGQIEDSPLAGVSWYYTAVDKNLYSMGSDKTLISSMRTRNPVEMNFAEAVKTVPKRRPTPLPILRISRNLTEGAPLPGNGEAFPEKQSLNPVTAAIVASMFPKNQQKAEEPAVPVILPIDANPSEQERQQALTAILQGSFAIKDWTSASQELFELLIANGTSPEARARIQFYRGQCAYFSGYPREAFVSFLTAQSSYYIETQPWLNRLYKEFYSLD